ncbi:MAG: hypothetical protein QME12_07555 [Nanoarchaeota archaeon]|nr:hypothetical protein [Nanoarchaeota archaeon]
MSKYLRFPVTNERLEAVVAGLDVKEGDRILAVCGSGDQAFALLENASYVLAADLNKLQVEYARTRAELLKQGNIDGFFSQPRDYNGGEANDFMHMKNYFSKKGRLGRIREKLDKAGFVNSGFTECLGIQQFNKFYISNIIGYYEFCMNSECCKLMRLLSGRLPKGGLIYIANNDEMERSRTYASAFIRLNQPDMWPKELAKDETLTTEAASRESSLWKPAVYRKL